MNNKIAINTYPSTTETKKQKSKQAEQKQSHRYREHFDSCQMGGGLEGWTKNVKGLRSTNQLLQCSHGDVKYSTGNALNNILITTYGVRWV